MAGLRVICAILCVTFAVSFVETLRIVWDNKAPMDLTSIEHLRMEEIRMPNWFFIFPGTKWCGAGNIAENYDDLGELARTDKCCRAHDNCADFIEGYQTVYNLTNKGFYSRLSCLCDTEFYQCLKSVNTRDAAMIGNIYFNALGTQCFKNDFPIVKCAKHVFYPLKKCLNYELDATKDKLYQWFDIPIF